MHIKLVMTPLLQLGASDAYRKRLRHYTPMTALRAMASCMRVHRVQAHDVIFMLTDTRESR